MGLLRVLARLQIQKGGPDCPKLQNQEHKGVHFRLHVRAATDVQYLLWSVFGGDLGCRQRADWRNRADFLHQQLPPAHQGVLAD